MAGSLDGDAVRAWLAGFTAAFRSATAELDDLDRQSGDGDFGTNLRSAIDRIDADLASAAVSSPAEQFTSVSKAFMHAGGTSGPLLGNDLMPDPLPVAYFFQTCSGTIGT